MRKETVIYVPKVAFPLREETGGICDFVFQGFYKENDAKDLYPNADIVKMVVQVPSPTEE